MDSIAIGTILTGFTTDLTGLVTANLPAVLTFVAGFVVLRILWRKVKGATRV